MSDRTPTKPQSEPEDARTPDQLAPSKYLPRAAAGGIAAYAVGLISAHYLYIQPEGGFDLATAAIFYAWIHGIVPIQSNTELVSGTALSQGGPPVVFFTLIFGIPIALVSHYTAKSLTKEYSHTRIDHAAFSSMFSAAYGVCLFLTANQFTNEEGVTGLFTVARTVTVSVDPTMSLVAGFVLCGVYGYVGSTVALQPENVKMEYLNWLRAGVVFVWVIVTGFWQLARAAS